MREREKDKNIDLLPVRRVRARPWVLLGNAFSIPLSTALSKEAELGRGNGVRRGSTRSPISSVSAEAAAATLLEGKSLGLSSAVPPWRGVGGTEAVGTGSKSGMNSSKYSPASQSLSSITIPCLARGKKS